MTMANRLKILFLAAEAAPFIKVGGLGDVAGSLPPAIRALPESPDIRVALPLHPAIDRGAFNLKPVAALSIAHRDGPIQAEVFAAEAGSVPVYLISGEPISAAGEVYSTDTYQDGIKFTFFSLAALALAKALDFRPDVLHAQDWHTAAAVYALSSGRQAFFADTATLLTVHNLPYLGAGAGPALAEFGLPPVEDSSLPAWAREMPLPLGLLTADKINTVSPGYAEEVLTPEFGAGLEEFLTSRNSDLTGILNGLDVAGWNPESDPALPVIFGLKTLTTRLDNKRLLQEELSLKSDAKIPLLAFIGRMDHQKGVEIALDALRQISGKPWQAVILGTGNPALEDEARQVAAAFPERVRAVIRFDGGLARRIYAGADMMMIPSRYEPCGLIQMIAMRYGCVPVARAVGGLKDTISDYQSGDNTTGFLFEAAAPDAMAGALERALNAYADQRRWRGLQRRGMQQDFSWARSAQKYLELYQTLVTA